MCSIAKSTISIIRINPFLVKKKHMWGVHVGVREIERKIERE
jgi:hypothetical protein